jgi:hypothetical protein
MSAARTAVLALGVTIVLARVASADPIVLRAPVPRRVVAATLGTPELSAGVWLTERFGLAVEWRLPAGAVGASAATRWTLVGDAMGWGVEFRMAAGLVVPLLTLAGGVSVTPAVMGRWRSDRVQVAANIVSPMVLRVAPDPTLRVPVLLELWLVVHVGPANVGVQGSVGSVYVPGLSWSNAVQVSGYLGWDL